MSLAESIALVVSNLVIVGGPVLGFISAWLLFVLQEHRKQRIAVESSRQSLIAELKWLESLLSIKVLKCATHSGILDQGIREFRWFLKEGVARNMFEELLPEQLESREKVFGYPDEEIAKLVSFFRHEKQAAEMPLSIINSVLAAPTSARLSADEIKRLIDVRWQSSMLATETRALNEFFHLTFTVSDEVNHNIVKQNHASSLRMYGRRASYMLDRVRAALNEITANDRHVQPGFISKWRLPSRFRPTVF